MNRSLLAQTWRSQRVKLAIVCLGLAVWGALFPIIYVSFSDLVREIMDSGLIPKQLMEFGGGDVFSLSGSIALGSIHPIALVLNSIFAVGFSVAAIAGERQRGTLEVMLARPLSRRTAYTTLLVAGLVFVAAAISATVVGVLVGSAIAGVTDELAAERLPLLWLNGVFLFGAITAIGLAASVSFDRLSPALGVTITIVVVMYFLDVIGQFWPDAAFLQPYSLFNYYDPKDILEGVARAGDFLVLAAVTAIAIGWALIEFPRRDLAAPS